MDNEAVKLIKQKKKKKENTKSVINKQHNKKLTPTASYLSFCFQG